MEEEKSFLPKWPLNNQHLLLAKSQKEENERPVFTFIILKSRDPNHSPPKAYPGNSDQGEQENTRVRKSPKECKKK